MTEAYKQSAALVAAAVIAISLLVLAVVVKVPTDPATEGPACACFDGIGSQAGDVPAVVYAIDGVPRLAVCGAVETDTAETSAEKTGTIMSEFDVFDCADGSSIARHSAAERVRVEQAAGGLQLTVLRRLPTGDGWDRRDVGVRVQALSATTDTAHAADPEWRFEAPLPRSERIDAFKKDLKTAKLAKSSVGKDIEETIDRLLVASLAEDEDSRSTLHDLEAYLGLRFDGSVAQHHADALELLSKYENSTKAER